MNVIPTIRDHESLLGLFFGAAWALVTSKGAEYILFADGCLAAPTPAIQLRCDVQRQQATNIDIIAQGQIDHTTSPSLL